MAKFTNKEIREAEEYYGWNICDFIKRCPEDFTRCEICGRILYYWTSVYCENECESKLNHCFECRFCWDCLKKIDCCPICGENNFGR